MSHWLGTQCHFSFINSLFYKDTFPDLIPSSEASLKPAKREVTSVPWSGRSFATSITVFANEQSKMWRTLCVYKPRVLQFFLTFFSFRLLHQKFNKKWPYVTISIPFFMFRLYESDFFFQCVHILLRDIISSQIFFKSLSFKKVLWK